MNRRQAITAGIISATAAATTTSVQAEDKASDNPELKKIRALLKAHDDALTAHDLDGVMAAFADGASVMGSGPGEWYTGDELKTAYEHFFMTFDKGEQKFDYATRVGGLSSKMGWMMTTGTVTGKRDGKDFEFPLNVSLSVSKGDDGWKIASMHFSTLVGEASE